MDKKNFFFFLSSLIGVISLIIILVLFPIGDRKMREMENQREKMPPTPSMPSDIEKNHGISSPQREIDELREPAMSPKNRGERTSVPLLPKNNFLPHNGLFIRRNNQFGTKLNIGIKNLLDQGILIEQDNIRFDDFIALDNKQIPKPSADESLAVSFGITSIPLKQKRNDQGTHYFEIALKTSDEVPKRYQKVEALPVKYIFVVDTSGSMAGDKLEVVKASIYEVFKTLKKNDVIGIIEFDSQARTILKATPVEKVDIDEFAKKVSSLTASGGTDINLGVSYGIAETRRFKDKKFLKQVYLFSDGNPSSGETNWIKIRQNLDKETKGNVKLSTFAFGEDANTRELELLAGTTAGKSTFVTEPDDIKFSLQEDLSRREYLVAINVQLKIDINPDIPIVYFYGHDRVVDPRARRAILGEVEESKAQVREELEIPPQSDLVTQEEGIRIFVPNLAIGETYLIAFELSLPDNIISIGNATVQYSDIFKRENRRIPLNLSLPGNLPSEVVIEHALGLWTSEVVYYALEDLYQQDLETAKKRIDNHVNILDFANKQLESDSVNDDAIVMKKFQSLSKNLGKIINTSDAPQVQRAFTYGLDQYGRARGGYNPAAFVSRFAPNR